MKFVPEEIETGFDYKIVDWFKWAVVLLGAGMWARLVFVTMVLGDYYSELASGNRIREERIEAKRGTIQDRNNQYLALNIQKEEKIIRHYPEGELTSVITGYLAELSEDELKRCEQKRLLILEPLDCYLGGVKGKLGIEGWYEERLKGKDGLRLVEETAMGEKITELDREEAVEGEDLVLNLDLDLQKEVFNKVRQAMKEDDLPGGVGIVSKVNGEVLALVSLPSYDANLFIKDGERGREGGEYSEAKKIVEDDEKKPMFDRVISGAYPPGSVFKPIVAMAALEEGVVDRNKLVEDTGEIKIGGARFGNWYFDKYGRKEGMINIVKALGRSNDVFFYKMGEWLGIDRLVEWSRIFGIGEPTGIDLPGEARGLLPTPLWREKTIGERWFLGNTYHMAIGQGDVLTTPLQANRWMAEVVSGKKCEPRLLGRADCKQIEVSKKNREILVEGMKQACMSGGTGFPLFDLEGRVICKTGTAQHGGEETEPHAWINVVVPVVNEKGEYGWNKIDDWTVITVMLEAGGEGSEKAGPVAREIVDFLLKQG